MLRSVFTLNRTKCNRARDETGSKPKVLPDPHGVGRSAYGLMLSPKIKPERLRRSLV